MILQRRRADAGQRDDGRVTFHRLQSWTACAPRDEQQGMVGQILKDGGLDGVFVDSRRRGGVAPGGAFSLRPGGGPGPGDRAALGAAIPPDSVSPLLPGVGVADGVLVLGESITAIVLAGVALVLAGVALTRRRVKPQQASIQGNGTDQTIRLHF